MKKTTIIFLLTCVIIAIIGIIVFSFVYFPQKSPKLGSDTIFLESDALPFKEVAGRLGIMLTKTPQDQTAALSALQGNALLVKNTPLLRQIVELAVNGEDYSGLDTAVSSLKATHSDEPITDKKLLAVGERAGVRQLALFIAVVNGSPEAMKELDLLNTSKSPTKQLIASSANKWVELHGTSNAPKPDPLLYGTRVVPFDKFVTDVTAEIASGDEKKRNAAVGYVIRNLEMKQFGGQSRETLVGLLKSYMEASSSKPGTEGYSLKLEAIRSASLAGGTTAKALLLQLSKSGDSPISEDAARALADFSTLHPDD